MTRRQWFKLYLPTASVVIVDPMYIDNIQRADGIANVKSRGSSPDLSLLLALEAIAVGCAEPPSEPSVFAFMRLKEPGFYAFPNDAIRRLIPLRGRVAPQSEVFSVDTAQIVLFDLAYLDSMLSVFEWKSAYLPSGAVDRRLEKANSQAIAGNDHAYVQVQAAPSLPGCDFKGDGEFFIPHTAFVHE